MNQWSDPQLLREYAARRSESAFAELVRRHVDLIYSAALRMILAEVGIVAGFDALWAEKFFHLHLHRRIHLDEPRPAAFQAFAVEFLRCVHVLS